MIRRAYACSLRSCAHPTRTGGQPRRHCTYDVVRAQATRRAGRSDGPASPTRQGGPQAPVRHSRRHLTRRARRGSISDRFTGDRPRPRPRLRADPNRGRDRGRGRLLPVIRSGPPVVRNLRGPPPGAPDTSPPFRGAPHAASDTSPKLRGASGGASDTSAKLRGASGGTSDTSPKLRGASGGASDTSPKSFLGSHRQNVDSGRPERYS